MYGLLLAESPPQRCRLSSPPTPTHHPLPSLSFTNNNSHQKNLMWVLVSCVCIYRDRERQI
uniref:Uncharacterized protein n=1 Tax=Glycine max TaxID=3847 RepID=K7MDP5_SOYBN